MADIRLTELGQIAFNVKDVKKSVAFYRDVLGVPFLFEAPGLAFFDLGGVRLMLSGIAEEEQHPASILYFRVADIDAAFNEFKGKGVTFEDSPHLIATMPDHELWMTFFRDPDDHLMGIMAEKPLTEKA